jgi:acyl CoA:acetate/3-ketoacid CoA transferase alpha subunit
MARPAVSRRALLTSAGAVTLGGSLTQAVTGCRFDPASSDSTAPPSADPSSATATAATDADAAIVASARAELAGLVAHLLAGVTSVENQTLVTFHTVQLKALGAEAPTSTRRRLTPAALVTQERRTQGRFVHWAEDCQSGELARVLAAVAAGIGMLPVVRGAAA